MALHGIPGRASKAVRLEAGALSAFQAAHSSLLEAGRLHAESAASKREQYQALVVQASDLLEDEADLTAASQAAFDRAEALGSLLNL